MMNNYDDDEDEHGGGAIVHDHHNNITPSPSDHSDGSSSSNSGFGPGIAMLPSPGIRSSSSRYQRFKSTSLVKQKKQPGLRIPLLRHHHLLSKNHTTILLILSILLILLPCTVYFLQLLLPLLLTQPYDGQGGVNDEDYDATTTKHHIKIANTIGKFSGSFLCLLLFPLKQYNSIFLTLGMSDVHAIRLHIFAGTGAILAGLGHGVYYIVIWLRRKGYRRYEDVFPDAECWKEMILEYGNENDATTAAAARMMRLLHNGEYEEDDDEDCQSKFITLLGVLGGTSFLFLGLSSIYSLRRRNYQLFYNVHVALSILLLFVLVMHYNKMIYYIAPGLLHYMGLCLPIGVESRYRSRRYSGGVKVKKITCIPDSGGCVDIEFSLSRGTYDNNDDEFDDDDDECNDVAVAVKDEESTISTMVATDASASCDDGYVGKQQGRQSPSSSLASVGLLDLGGESSNINYQTSTKGNLSIHDTVGKYIQLHVPDLSNQSHPFTIFAPCRTPTSCRRQPSSSVDSVHILFRPFGSFTTALSNRLQALSLLQPHPTVSIRDKSTSCPTMFVNGMRCNTLDMLHKATMTHDKVVIVAGGVGIVPYISLLHAIRQQCMTTMSNIMNDKKRIEAVMNDESIIVKNHLRLINNDGEVGDEEDDYLEIGLEKVQDAEQNGHGGDTYLSHSSRTYRTKCIDVHWMSRDEGLVRHVLKNYLEPYCHVDDELISIDMRNGSPPAACPISINFIVHHTSLKSSTVDPARTESICYINDQPEPTSWAPCQDHVSTAVEGKTSSAYYAFPNSVYKGNNQSTMQNVIPTVTYASIVFGGMWIVNYCYTNIQNKKVFQTRPIAVVSS